MKPDSQPLLEQKAAKESELQYLQGQIDKLQKHAGELTRSVDNLTLQIEREKPIDTDRAALEQYWATQARTRQEAIERREQLLDAGIKPEELAGPAKSPLDEALARKGQRAVPQFFSLPPAIEATPSDEPPAKPSLEDRLRFPNNPWTKAHWNITEQMRVIKADPKKAERMAVAAGVDVNAIRPVR